MGGGGGNNLLNPAHKCVIVSKKNSHTNNSQASLKKVWRYPWGEVSNLFILALPPPLPHKKSKRKKKRKPHPLGLDSCYKVSHTPNSLFTSDLLFLAHGEKVFFCLCPTQVYLHLAFTPQNSNKRHREKIIKQKKGEELSDLFWSWNR